MTPLRFTALLAATQLVIARPIAAPAKVTVKQGEQPTATLPKGTPQAHGLATNWTWSESSSVKSVSKNNGVPVSISQVDDLKKFARLATVAYCTDSFQGTSFTCKNYCSDFPGTIVLSTFDTPEYGTVGFIARNDNQKAIYVVYRGSSSTTNFAQDIKFATTSYPAGGEVHLGSFVGIPHADQWKITIFHIIVPGFYENYEESRDLVYNTVVSQMKKGYKLHLIGHSLGGSVAVLQALDFYQNAGFDNSNTITYTYGEPRLGDPDFARYVNKTGLRIFRTISMNDIVPHLPPSAFGYLHHSGEYWIKNSAGDVVLCAIADDDTCADSTVPFTSIPAHLLYWE
ncbi:A serine protease triad forms the catalytic Centre of A triacylglycerol lipase [Jimgerdemannia flammicorona]|uniref:A serine protease triad forms the catalytic Centre of A triacylglycerol lipase n=1 Tax=Jimgerdemannia flammicorona TaxID=994334 RepID=A0A433D1R6_9FUNG|nr:A serine protease triad forms the catalytic Centre of A triacylglycerol lipase [Jimgerdemannia flammicorona]